MANVRSSIARSGGITLFIILTQFFCGHVLNADSSKEASVAVDHVALTKQLIMTWNELISDPSQNQATRKQTAKELYGLIFILWFATAHEGKDFPYMNQNRLPILVKKMQPYINEQDPLGIQTNYENGQLTSEGQIKIGLLPLTERTDAFNAQKNYQQLVSQFVAWHASPYPAH